MSSTKITFEEFLNRLEKDPEFNEKDVRAVVAAINNAVQKGLLADRQVRLSSFGQLEVKKYPAREGRHPQTGEVLQIPAQNRAVFKSGKQLAESVNQKYEHLEPEVLKDEKNVNPAAAVPFTRGHFELSKRKYEFLVAATMIITAVIIALLFAFLLKSDKPEIVEEIVEPVPIEEIIVPEPKTENVSTVPADIEHRVRFAERLWTISDDYYETPYWWPVIFERNETTIPHPDFIREGMRIFVPDIKNREDSNEFVARAYLKLYQTYRKDYNDEARDFLYAARVFDKNVVDELASEIPSDDLAYAMRE